MLTRRDARRGKGSRFGDLRVIRSRLVTGGAAPVRPGSALNPSICTTRLLFATLRQLVHLFGSARRLAAPIKGRVYAIAIASSSHSSTAIRVAPCSTPTIPIGASAAPGFSLELVKHALALQHCGIITAIWDQVSGDSTLGPSATAWPTTCILHRHVLS
jgi:hypothetical protein